VHRRAPAFGVNGGEPGQVGRNWVVRGDGSIEELAGADSTEMKPGDVFVIETPGGGGFGQWNRDWKCGLCFKNSVSAREAICMRQTRYLGESWWIPLIHHLLASGIESLGH
jgi:N-methylhydantoinase B/oxoprolinase/acetone carboxylase alpha subunit